MKTLKIIALSLLTATAASAADLPRKSTTPAAVMAPIPLSWQGGYIGAHLGYGAFTAKDNFLTSATGNGFLGGLQAGYDWQFGQFVAGLAGDISLANVRGSTAAFGSARVKNAGSLRVRAGFAATPAFLLYGTGGWAYANTDYSFLGLSSSASTPGYTLGLGGEFKIDRNWSAFGEYRYTKLNQTSLAAGAWRIDTNTNTFAVGVNYRF